MGGAVWREIGRANQIVEVNVRDAFVRRGGAKPRHEHGWSVWKPAAPGVLGEAGATITTRQ